MRSYNCLERNILFKLINGSFFSIILSFVMYRVYIEDNHHFKNVKNDIRK